MPSLIDDFTSYSPTFPAPHSPVDHYRHLAPASISWSPCRVKNVYHRGLNMRKNLFPSYGPHWPAPYRVLPYRKPIDLRLYLKHIIRSQKRPRGILQSL
jgi:hypothetical protein